MEGKHDDRYNESDPNPNPNPNPNPVPMKGPLVVSASGASKSTLINGMAN